MKQITLVTMIICLACSCRKETMTRPDRQSAPDIEAGANGSGSAAQRNPVPGNHAPVRPASSNY